MFFIFVFGIDEDVIEVYYHKNVKLFYQDLINVALERGRYVGQSKRHDLILKVAITGPKGCFPFIAFLDPHSIIGIDQIEFGEMLSPT